MLVEGFRLLPAGGDALLKLKAARRAGRGPVPHRRAGRVLIARDARGSPRTASPQPNPNRKGKAPHVDLRVLQRLGVIAVAVGV
jgi:hypothetical protein